MSSVSAELWNNLKRERDLWKARAEKAEAEITRLLACLHRPNPTNVNEWRVAPGKGMEFSRTVAAINLAPEDHPAGTTVAAPPVGHGSRAFIDATLKPDTGEKP